MVRSAEFRRWVLCFAMLLLVPILWAQKTTAKPVPKPSDDNAEQLKLRFRLQTNPHDKHAHDELISILSKKYAFRAELEEYGTWLRNNPDDFVSEIEMSSLATAAVNDPEYAIAVDRFILGHVDRSLDPEDYDFVSDRMAFLILDRGRFSEALEILEKATVKSPDDYGVWENLGDAEVRAGHADSAIGSYQKSIALDGNQEGPHEGLARAFLALGKFGDAETEFKAAIAIYNAQIHGGAPTDTFHLAMRQIQGATHDDPTLAKLHCELARDYVAQRKFAEALNEIGEASAANPDNRIEYEYLRASVLDAEGQLDEAKAIRVQAGKDVQSEMMKERQDAAMKGTMAYPEALFMSFEDDELTSAHEVIGLLEPVRGSLKVMDEMSLGMAFCTVGNAPECKALVEDVIRSDSKFNNPTSNYNLAKALMKAHDPVGAAGHFRQAYELDPENMTYRMDFEDAKKWLSSGQ